MAFNFGGFVGGFSSKVVERFEEEERRAEDLAKEQRSIATRQRLAREEEKRRKEILAEELSGQLGMYFDESQVEAIMGKGVGAAKEAVLLGQNAAAKGMSPAALINIPTAADLTDTETTAFANDVISTSDALPTVTTSVMDADSLEGTERPKTSSGLFNLEYYGKIMAPADDEQATLDAAYAVAVQKSINGSTPDIRAKNEKLAARYLEKIKEKDAALSNKGTDSSPFSKSSLESIQKQQMKLALEENEFSVDLEGRLTQKVGNKIPEYNVAVLQANSRMRTLNTGDDGLPMSPQLHNLTKDNVQNAVKKIQLDARRLIADPQNNPRGNRLINPTQPIEQSQLQANANSGEYKIGDIIYVQQMENGMPVTRIKVYTGIVLSSIHNNFIDAGRK
jgi:hypothetical protein